MNFQIKFVEYTITFCIATEYYDLFKSDSHPFIIRFVFRYLSVCRPFCSVLLVVFPFCPSGRYLILVRYESVLYSSREPRTAAASTVANGRPTGKGSWQFFYNPLDANSR